MDRSRRGLRSTVLGRRYNGGSRDGRPAAAWPGTAQGHRKARGGAQGRGRLLADDGLESDARRFYEAAGAYVEADNCYCKLTGDALERLAS